MSASTPHAAEASADFCRLLAACYYEPEHAFAEEHVFASMEGAAERIDGELSSLSRSLGVAFEDPSLEALRVDYARLFLGPGEMLASPYACVWLDGTTAGAPSTAALVQLYRQGGFAIAEDFRELPDHVAAELEFLYLLLFRRDAALRARLVREHLGVWIPPFCDALRRGAETEFYRRLADVTERFIALEARR